MLSDEEALDILHEFNDGSLAQLPYEGMSNVLARTTFHFVREEACRKEDKTSPFFPAPFPFPTVISFF